MAIDMQVINEAKFKSLRKFNAVMCVLHLVQAAGILALSNDYTIALTTAFLKKLPGVEMPQTVTEGLYDLRLGPLVAVFLLISAVAHFIMASPFGFPWYVRNLKKKINYLRWYEYSLSASLMVVIIAILSGVYDAPSLVLLFVLTAAMNFFGLMMELHNRTTERTDWTSYIFGCIAGIFPWVILFWYFTAAFTSADDAIPTFVYYIMASLFVLFFSFAVNMLLQYKKVGPWRDYLFGEKVYMILSLVAKSALAWQVFGGILARG
ncbi:MAG: heliorhodopsin HeR [Dehalococcoidia bacterium]|nr:MAG: heliorhodopsin HeR [Dehalococcoidia bacterium]